MNRRKRRERERHVTTFSSPPRFSTSSSSSSSLHSQKTFNSPSRRGPRSCAATEGPFEAATREEARFPPSWAAGEELRHVLPSLLLLLRRCCSLACPSTRPGSASAPTRPFPSRARAGVEARRRRRAAATTRPCFSFLGGGGGGGVGRVSRKEEIDFRRRRNWRKERKVKEAYKQNFKTPPPRAGAPRPPPC